MDEEDGRSGALAVQAGHADAPRGVPTPSLQITRRRRFTHCHPERSEGSAVRDSPLTTTFLNAHLRFLFVARVGDRKFRVPEVDPFDLGDFRTPSDLIQNKENNENVPGK
jgi:hypothetical protein